MQQFSLDCRQYSAALQEQRVMEQPRYYILT
jgi:hypothetical protein